MRKAPRFLAALSVLPPLLLAQTHWRFDAPLEVRRMGTFQTPGLTESSAVVVSRTQAGVLWTLDDSGNPAWLYATDTLGNDWGTYEVVGAQNQDWEVLASGPCGKQTCLYIGDTGDNKERRKSAVVYRVVEPQVTRRPTLALQPTAPAAKIELRYPDGPHDVEAMYLDAAGNLYLITKGRSKGVLLFRVPADAWTAGRTVSPELVQSLPIEPDRRLGRLITDAALSPDGRLVVVRTYIDLFFLHRSSDGRLDPGSIPTACAIPGVETQGEGVDWINGTTLVLTSEGPLLNDGTILLVRCQLP